MFGLIGIGLLLLAGGAWMLHRKTVTKLAEAKSWPRTTGTVESCDILYNRNRRDGNNQDSWRVALRYAYEVNGSAHLGEKVRLGPDPVYRWEKHAHAEAARYPVGSPVSVAYNPADANDSALDTDRANNSWRFIALVVGAIGVVFVLVGLA